jgi:hypothetical protein
VNEDERGGEKRLSVLPTEREDRAPDDAGAVRPLRTVNVMNERALPIPEPDRSTDADPGRDG